MVGNKCQKKPKQSHRGKGRSRKIVKVGDREEKIHTKTEKAISQGRRWIEREIQLLVVGEDCFCLFVCFLNNITEKEGLG